MSLSQDAGSIAAASLSETQPVPESSPPSPEKGLELSVADFVARLTALEKKFKKVKKDNAKLRESIAATEQGEEEWQEGGWQEEEEWQDGPAETQGDRREEEEWRDEAAAASETEKPAMPVSYMMTPQKPPGNLEE